MRKRIMIVEDEEAIAKMIAMNLKIANMSPVIFGDGEKAVSSLPTDHDFDLALLDIMVPGKNGFEILEALKPYGIPAIFLTAKDDVYSKVEGLQNGAEDYIVKPFEILELMVRIDKVLTRNRKAAPYIRFHNIEVDVEKHIVMKDNIEVLLKPMEFELFYVLLKNLNIAVSREDLLGLVWGSNYLGETRTVDVHISQLRKKLDLHDSLKTVSKLGYRLEE